MLKERLISVLNDIVKLLPNCNQFGGICDILEYYEKKFIISHEERKFISKLLHTHKPTVKNQYKEFTENNFWTKSRYGYWWDAMFEYEETIQIRIDYLKKVIENIESIK